MKKTFIIIITIILLGCSKDWQYLGQYPPGERPEVFAEGIISGLGRVHSFPAISKDGKQILWMTLPPKIMEVHYEKGKWSEPSPYEPLKDIVALRPNFGPCGDLLFSSAQIPDGKGSLDIWRLNDKGEILNLGDPINTKYLETCHSFTNTGDMYYTSYVQDKKWDRGIMVSKFKDGEYQTPQPLREHINTPDMNTIDYLSFVSADGSFLLFSSNRHDTSKESCHIYVSFLDDAGNWGDPLDLSEFLYFHEDSRDPALSPDGKYLFFSSGENIYWVSTTVIDKIRSLVKN